MLFVDRSKRFVTIFAAYGIVHTFAQDLGIKPGKKQNELVHSMPFQVLILFSGAFSVTDNFTLALYATIIFYYLKYVYSKGITID